MHFTRFTGFHNQTNRGAQALTDQVMMHSRCRQQSRNWNPVCPHHPVGQDDDVIAAMHRRFGALAQALKRVAHTGSALFHRKCHVQRLGIERVFDMADAPDFFQIAVGQDRLPNFQTLAAGIAVEIKQVRARADERNKAHHQFFADRVNRRIGDLREILLEVGIEQLGLVGQNRDRRVGSHRADCLLPRGCHRGKQQLKIFRRVAKGLLPVEQRDIGA